MDPLNTCICRERVLSSWS